MLTLMPHTGPEGHMLTLVALAQRSHSGSQRKLRQHMQLRFLCHMHWSLERTTLAERNQLACECQMVLLQYMLTLASVHTATATTTLHTPISRHWARVKSLCGVFQQNFQKLDGIACVRLSRG